MAVIRKNEVITVIGAGLAGCEAAWQAAQAGVRVRLLEMKPKRYTPHTRYRILPNSFAAIRCVRQQLRMR